ncbi:MAG: hypothetical protein AAGA60_24585 [Cyanobacteria bacterium P01_E01_bin.42]
MRAVSIEQWELLLFFEVEPEFYEPNDVWPYTTACYRVQQGEISLEFSIYPACRDIQIILEVQGNCFYELGALEIEDVRYFKNAEREILEISLTKCDRLLLQVRPNIKIWQEIAAEIS